MTDKLRQGTRRVMKDFEIGEVSGVDRPAQEGADVVIEKNDDRATVLDQLRALAASGDASALLKAVLAMDPERIEKYGAAPDLLTSIEGGHQHGVTVSRDESGQPAFYVRYANAGDDEMGHDHEIVMGGNGTFDLSLNHGHTHTVDSARVRELMTERGLPLPATADPAPVPPTAVKAASTTSQEVGVSDELRKAEERLAALQAEVATLNQVVALPSTHRAHYDALPANERPSFLAKSAVDRNAEIEAFAKADPVEYTTADGLELRKSAGPLAIQLAKRADQQAELIATMQGEALDAELTKRAETELAHLPGDIAIRKALLQAVDGIAAETRPGVLELLKAADTSAAGAFATIGTSNAPTYEKAATGKAGAQQAHAELEKLAKAYAAEHGVDFATAYTAVSDTHPALLAKAIG